ncbi:MAG: VOC family protein [Hyphomonadaceae bacterium]|nr:VOC family protein [Hyphomonadaceae bacterium]
MFKAVHPVLGARDVTEAVAWYVERLGFRELFNDGGVLVRYAGIARDGVELHLQWHDVSSFAAKDGDSPMYRFMVDDPDALFEEYRDKGIFHDRTALRDTPWGTREFAFYDLNGHGLTFYRDREAPPAGGSDAKSR